MIFFQEDYLSVICRIEDLFRVQSVKNLLAMQETWVQFLGWEDPLEKEIATHSSILSCRMPWKEEFGGLQGLQELDMT